MRYSNRSIIIKNINESNCSVTYSGSHVAELAAEQGEDVILQHELHLVFVDFFLFRKRKRLQSAPTGGDHTF